jgi:hypothetical protein
MRKAMAESFDVTEILAHLARTPLALDAWLRGIPAAWCDANEGPDTWSPREIVGHLVHGDETDWVTRARIILDHGESRSFDPFDRFAQRTRFAGWPLERLIDRFSEIRSDNVATVRGWRLTREQLDRTGMHPSLGTLTLRNLLATWGVHDLAHTAQIARVLAKQAGANVGPWREYLPILDR